MDSVWLKKIHNKPKNKFNVSLKRKTTDILKDIFFEWMAERLKLLND